MGAAAKKKKKKKQQQRLVKSRAVNERQNPCVYVRGDPIVSARDEHASQIL